MSVWVLAVVDGTEFQDAKCATGAAHAGTAAGMESGLDVLGSRVRGRGLGCQREESNRPRLHHGDSLGALHGGGHFVGCVVDFDGSCRL